MGGSAPRRDRQLPVETTSFVDRRDELAEGRELLARARLVTLTGPGGVGKTRLAARLATRVARAFPDGVRFVHLAGLHDPALVPLAAADALGLHDHSPQPPLDALAEHVRDRRLLLVVDNCEHLLPACADLAAALLRGTMGVRVLATSRHRLGLTEEHLLDVRPLPVPDPDGDLSAADGYPALALFADRAAAVVPGFRLTAANRAAVARLCRRLDGLPLAIELAAVRMRVLGVDQLLDRLDDRYRLLNAGSPAALPRHQTLCAAIDWSHELCTEREQLVWARASVLAGSFDLDTAESVCADGGGSEVAVPQAGGRGISETEVPPADGWEGSETEVPRAGSWGRGETGVPLAGGWEGSEMEVPRAGGWEGSEMEVPPAGGWEGSETGVPSAGGWGRSETGVPSAGGWEGSEAGVPRAGGWGTSETGVPSAGGWEGSEAGVPRAGGWGTSETGVPSAGGWEGSEAGVPPAGGRLRVGAHDVLEAVAGLVDKSVLCREPGPDGVRYRLLFTLRHYGLVQLRRLPGEETAARRRQRDWMQQWAAARERAWFGPGQRETVARLRADQDNLRAALDFCLTTPGERLAGLRLAGTLWFYWHACGAPREGRYWLDRALAANPEPTPERARGLWVAGLLAAATQDLARGLGLAKDARRLARHLGDPAETAHAEYVVGVLQLFGNDLQAALAHFETAVARGRVPGQHLSMHGLDKVELACALALLGQADRAVGVCDAALRDCEEHHEDWVRSYLLRILALAHTVRRDWSRAERHALDALRLKLDVNDVIGIALTLDLLAVIAAERGTPERAAALLGAADRVWADIDRDRWGSDALTSARRRCEEGVRATLDGPAFQRSYERGSAYGLTEAVAYALSDEQPPDETTERPSNGVRLTRREAEVAALVAEGLANQQIADRLVIARRTAEGHVERILSKLGFSNRSQIAAWVTAQR